MSLLFTLLLLGLDSPPLAFEASVSPPRIYGGEPVGPCEWPFVVALDEACTGVLVTPRHVLTAAHCGTGLRFASFGEDAAAPAHRVALDGCTAFPGGEPGQGNDLMICELAEPQLVPTARLLHPDEVEAIEDGTEAVLVGFGSTESGTSGIKRAVRAPLGATNEAGELQIGGAGRDTCLGDSGGPALVELDDGVFGVVGITSYGFQCGEGGWYAQPHLHEEWLAEHLDTSECAFPWHRAPAVWEEACLPPAQQDEDPCDPQPPGGGCAVASRACPDSGTLLLLLLFFPTQFAERRRVGGYCHRRRVDASAHASGRIRGASSVRGSQPGRGALH